MPSPYQPTTNALAMALTLPEVAIQCFVAELRRGSIWIVPYHAVVATLKVLWGTACLPASLLSGQCQVRRDLLTALSAISTAGCHTTMQVM
jgi:hypothetical protein